MSKCIVPACLNHIHQGRFVGNVCKPCYEYYSSNFTTSYVLEDVSKWIIENPNKIEEGVLSYVKVYSI